MNSPQPINFSNALMLPQENEPNTIAALLNQMLNSRGILARVGSHGSCLGILLESVPVPDQDEMVAAIRRLFADLKPASIKFLKIAGYQSGQNLPVWYEEIELEGATALAEFSSQITSVESWLNQGLEPLNGYNLNHQLTALQERSVASPVPNGILSIHNIPSYKDSAVNQQRFLRFHINERETALLSLGNIQQVLKVPVMEILPVPHMPDCVVGIYNWRGQMLWLVDLAQQLGFTSPLMEFRRLETVNTIVIQSDHTCLGMVVAQTIDIETHNLQQLQPPTAGLFSAKLLSCMQGYFAASGSPVLHTKALIQDPLLQIHCSR